MNAKKKILVVEDDSDINDALKIRLGAAGYSVYQAEDGLQGLISALREQPDLLILDISLPAGDGFSVIERARQHDSMANTPFIMITASKRPELRVQAMAMGAAAFLEKPYSSSELLAKVSEAVGSTSTI
jgi:DNA-binding response OmpR family regulator